MGKILFAVVSNDQYELPFIIGTFDDCIKYTGEGYNSVQSKMSKHRKNPDAKWTGDYKWLRLKEVNNDDN